MKRLLMLFLAGISLLTGATAQQLIYHDWVYDPNVQTVQFYRGTYPMAYPVFYMNQPLPLTLEFDEVMPLDQMQSDLMMEIVSCDLNWNPSGILPIEFYKGFPRQRIQQFQRSTGVTKIPYVHYAHSFPAEGEFFKMSGNYLLKVYRNSRRGELLLSRRFLVAENAAIIQPVGVMNARMERLRLGQFRFLVQPSNALQVINPNVDLRVAVLQNFRWETGQYGLTPRIYANNQLDYDLNFNNFTGGAEFRFHDIRSTRLWGGSVRDITEYEDQYEVTLFTEKTRAQQVINPQPDYNGGYFSDVLEWTDPRNEADYLMNVFRLQAAKVPDAKVYVIGRFSDWHTLPANEMKYVEEGEYYEARIRLKQGVYDYAYALRDSKGLLEEARFEGPNRDGENFYQVLVYHRGMGDRNDRLVGFLPVNYYDE